MRPPDRDSRALHHVCVFALDIDRSIRFYTAAFGCSHCIEWEEAVTDAGVRFAGRGVMLRAGESTFIEIFPADADAEEQGFPVRGQNHFCFATSDCQAAYRRALAAGARAYAPARVRSRGIGWDGSPVGMTVGGARPTRLVISYLKGPDGEIIELLQGNVL
jgi:catechol 2,3-dioxygenase-like lactoylglutathione lyase family enzyme